MKKNILLLTLIIFAGCMHSEKEKIVSHKEVSYSVEQLKEDFKVFRISLQEIHPGLYSFISKDSLDIYFDKTASMLNDPMTKDAFFKLLTPLIVKLYDEHTSLDFSYKYDSIKKLLPIKIRWVNNKPFIYKNLLQDPKVILGTEVISINGRNANDLYKELRTTYQNGTPDQTLEYDVYSLHFDYLYASFIEQPDSFTIEALNPLTKAPYTIHLPAVLKSDTAHCLWIPQTAESYCKKDTTYRFKMNKASDLALMKISGLNPHEMEATNINFYKQLDADFKAIEINKINNLIIDLRHCFGGDPLLGAELVSYLCRKPFHLFDTITSPLNGTPTFAQYTNWTAEDWKTEIPLLKKLKGTNAVKNDWTVFRDTIILPKRQFKGQIYVLVNSDIHSAAAITAALLRYNTKAVFIGTPISGPYNSGNAIDILTVTLPNTKINLFMPVLHYSYSIPDNVQPVKKGLVPDMVVSPNIGDILNNRDLVLDSTVSIIISKHH